MQQIRVLVIDDSAFMRKMLTDILEKDPRIEVIGTARNGRDGINKIRQFSPDVVTMDVHMPVLDGIAALREIMRTTPLPVIMLSSNVGDGTESAIKAIEYGAVDFIMKPSGEISLNIETIQEEIITKIIAAKEATLSYPIMKNEKQCIKMGRKPFFPKQSKNSGTLIVIGTSTGGPRALQRVLTKLPSHFKWPILIVQHMPPLFTKSLANRLDSLTNIHVKEAVQGEPIQAGTAYIAPGDNHMTVEKVGTSYAIRLSQDPPIHNHRPSVDALFNSVAKLSQTNKIAVVLTGMGHDGAAGTQNIKRSDENAIVIAESEETSVIYGMPKAVYKTGIVDEVLPLDEIGNFLASLS